MREIDLIDLASKGWITEHDPVTAFDAYFSPDLRNLNPQRRGLLKMEKGYERAGLTWAGGAALVALFGAEVEDLTSGVTYACIIYSFGGGLWVDEITTADADDLAAGNTAYSVPGLSGTELYTSGNVDANTYWEFCVYQNKIYMFNKATGYVVWRDTTWQVDELDAGGCTDPPPTGVSMPRMFAARMWLGKGRELYYSELSPDT